MSDTGSMFVAVQRRAQPGTVTFIEVAMHRDLSRLLAADWEFPRVRTVQNAFGAILLDGPLTVSARQEIRKEAA